MKNTSRKPHIYKVTNLETGQYYIGSQCSGKTVGINYFTSSTNKAFREDFKAHKEEKYKIEIIKEFENPEECVRVENYMISDHMQLKDGLCLNRACCCSGEKIFSTLGVHPSEETKQKLSLSKKGHPGWNKGMHLPEETKQKMSEAHKGLHHTEEARKKISTAKKIKISIEGEVFNSLTDAAKYYNVVTTTIIYWAKNNKHNAFYITK